MLLLAIYDIANVNLNDINGIFHTNIFRNGISKILTDDKVLLCSYGWYQNNIQNSTKHGRS